MEKENHKKYLRDIGSSSNSDVSKVSKAIYNEWTKKLHLLHKLTSELNGLETYKINQTFYLLYSISRTFTRQFRYHCLTEQLNFERTSTIHEMMKFPSLCKHYYSVIVKYGLNNVTRKISMYQSAGAEVSEQRLASWLAHIC